MRDQESTAFCQFIDTICEKHSLQKKALKLFLKRQDRVFWERAEDFAREMLGLIDIQGLSIEYVADSYLVMCKSMIIEQIKFKKTGKYPCENASVAYANTYSSEKEMASYMYGLALSYFLWPNHYLMYDFFISESKKLQDINTYLEIGPGHGLFLVESIKNFPHAKFEAIDISPISKNISETIVKHFTRTVKCKFQILDVNHLESGKYDYIVMCEVLEHLDDPVSILIKLKSLLSEQGRLFITTCANCPAVDHVYQYHNVEHIRTEIREAGFKIVSELPLPVGDFPESQWAEQNIEVNYAAMLKSV